MDFTINNNLGFVDRMQFMNSSLNGLIKILSDNDFKYLSQEFSGELLELVKQKGKGDKLLDRCEFFSSSKDECINEKYYLRAINVWNMFKINTMGDYYHIYLKTDVLLLADVFEKFIDTCLQYHGLDILSLF